MHPIKIVKHKQAHPLKEHGDILLPFEDWNTTRTGGDWYSKIPEEYYSNKSYFPLKVVAHNSWEALRKLGIEHEEFKKMLEYTCPYNGYLHYWAVPILIFTKDVQTWTARYKLSREERFWDDEWVRKFFPPKIKEGLPFTKVQRSLLGPGYIDITSAAEGSAYLYDALVALDNEDFLAVKVWIWFTKT